MVLRSEKKRQKTKGNRRIKRAMFERKRNPRNKQGLEKPKSAKEALNCYTVDT